MTECCQCHQDIIGTKHVCPGPLYRVYLLMFGYRLSTGEKQLLTEPEKVKLIQFLNSCGLVGYSEQFIGGGVFR